MVQVLVGMPSTWTINHEFTNLVLGRVVAGFSLCAAAVRKVTCDHSHFECQWSIQAALQLHAWTGPASNLPSRTKARAHDEQKYLVCAHAFPLKLQ
jgi:hypothetical protein